MPGLAQTNSTRMPNGVAAARTLISARFFFAQSENAGSVGSTANKGPKSPRATDSLTMGACSRRTRRVEVSPLIFGLSSIAVPASIETKRAVTFCLFKLETVGVTVANAVGDCARSGCGIATIPRQARARPGETFMEYSVANYRQIQCRQTKGVFKKFPSLLKSATRWACLTMFRRRSSCTLL